MQILPGIIQILNGSGSWAGSNGEHGETPKITVALAARLVIDLRGADRATPESADLAPYPFAEFADCVSWYIAFDSDYDQLTMPPIKRSTGISITQDAGEKTILAADLPILDSPEIRATVKTAGEIPLKGEIGALDADGNSVFVFDFPIILKNRVYIPGGGGDTPDPEDPEYLNTDQVQAFVISKLAEAIAELDLPEGETGPAPTLSIGTVTVGETAAAEVVPAGEGAYAINLTLPRATDGITPEPITPQITVGTIQAGTEAAASLVPVSGTPGAFTLNLTLPRGADGSGVTPSGQWAADATYNLNAAVRHASAWWRSLHDDNLGNEPPANRADNAHWEVIVKDGVSSDPLVVNYNDTDDPDDDGWHLYRIATDRYYRFTTNGGLTFTEAMELSQAPLNVLILFNPDATTDWQNVPAPVGTNNYHIATGKYYRVKTDAGIWGTPQQIHALDATEIFRVQYGATPENEEDEPEWHANFQPGDDRILFYNTIASIRLDIEVTLGDGEEIGGVQLCSISDPWHATYAATDEYRKISVDSGLTWTVPIPLHGKSAYQEWLDLGNTGTAEDFLNSLQAQFPAGTAGQVLLLGASGPYWGDLAAYTPVTPPPEPPEEVDLGLEDLPDGTEKRIWEYLPVRRPADNRDLHLFWQSSADGQKWGTLYSSATHPHCVRTLGANDTKVEFSTAYGPAMLPVEYIPVLEIHVRTCWGYLEEGIWVKGDWTYHNTLGVKLSLEGLPLEKPDYFNPEYFLIPIPEGTDQCEFRLSTDDDFRKETVLFSNTIYETDPKGFFFDGQNLLPATTATAQTLPVPFNAAAFEGQWFVFKRRGIAQYHIRAVWTGDNPVIYEWNPQQAYLQED